MNINLNNKNFDKCCRSCLNDGAAKIYDIFENCEDGANIAEMFFICTSIQVTKEDYLPKKLCSNCYHCIISFHNFKSTAFEVDTILKKYFIDQVKQEQVNFEQDSDKDVLYQPEIIKIEYEDENTEHNYSSEVETANNDYDTLEETEVTENINPIGKNITVKELKETCNVEEKKYNKKQSKTKSIKFTCEICNKKFRKQSNYENHIQIHKKKLTGPETLHDHPDYDENLGDQIAEQNDSNNTGSYVCDVCSIPYRSIQSLSAHKRAHITKDRVLKCSICGKIFKKMSHLKRHELIHNDSRPYKCTSCTKTFPTEALLSAHMNKHNGIKNHQCPICPKKFSYLSSLTTHLKFHTRDKPYLCPMCGKMFESSTNLAQHMKRHDGVKRFACNLCPKRFFSKGELKNHSSTHSSEKLFTCDVCSRAFSKRSCLVKHKRIHIGVKPYQCDVCAMKFADKYHLKRHYRVHTGEKPYRCEICDRAFTQSNDLVKHKRTHLGNNLYKCNECSQSFRLKSGLRQHISEHFISSQLKSKPTDDTG